MKNVRIIPRLDIKGPNLVKGIHLEGLRVLGKPEDFAKFYYETGADELLFQDVVASLFERNSLHEIISRTTKNVFIPLTVGGGIRNIEDISTVLRAGADKVSINTAAIRNPKFIKEASRKYGSSTIVVTIEAIKQPDGRYLAFIDNGREETGIEVLKWAQEVEDLGAGEIIITSVDREGTGEGYDLELIHKVSTIVNIPVIAHGGASNLLNVKSAIVEANADAVAIASMFHYNSIEQLSRDSNAETEGNHSFIQSGNKFGLISSSSIKELKEYFKMSGIACRPI